jgi:predicted peptidase
MLTLLTTLAMLSMQYDKGDWRTLWWLPNSAPAAEVGTQVAIEDGQTIPHLMFIPPGTPPADGWPLLVFLHGQGESQGGAALPSVALQGPPQQAGRIPQQIPFAILSPQKPMDSQFFDDEVAEAIMRLVDKYVASLKLDGARLYLTGLSQGGIGTWGLAAHDKYAHRFAAIAPVCGGLIGGRMHKQASQLSDTPVWAFHGANDEILPVSLSDDAVAALKATERTQYAGDVKYTRIEHARGSDYAWAAAGVPHMEGHASWVDAYYPPGTKVTALPPLYEWLLTHQRRVSPPSSSTTSALCDPCLP